MNLRALLCPAVFLRLFLLLVFCSSWPVYAGSDLNKGMEKISIINGAGKNKVIAVFNVKTVSTVEDKRKGLSGVKTMPDDSGMMFILDPGQQSYFWMKGMEFPLDIIFFDRDRRLIGSFTGLLTCDECRMLRTPEGSAYALEINAGMAKKYSLQKGDRFVVGKDEREYLK
jgi:uncharacterized membrane protein (UPF0127 family)